MNRLPDVVGLILCESLDVDVETGVTSLVGIFNSRHFWDFPSPVDQFTVFATLHAGVGEGTMQIVVSRLETEQDIDIYTQWLSFPERGLFVTLEVQLKKLVFAAPGRYSLTLRFNEQYITHRYLEIIRSED